MGPAAPGWSPAGSGGLRGASSPGSVSGSSLLGSARAGDSRAVSAARRRDVVENKIPLLCAKAARCGASPGLQGTLRREREQHHERRGARQEEEEEAALQSIWRHHLLHSSVTLVVPRAQPRALPGTPVGEAVGKYFLSQLFIATPS